MVTHSIAMRGAQIAYLLMAKVLKGNSFDIRIYADSQGAYCMIFLRQKFL